MLDHVGVQVRDVEASRDFYLAVFAALGIAEFRRIPTDNGPVIGFCGPDGMPDFWLAPAERTDSRETHIALQAPSRDAVDQVHAAALTAGAEVLHAPREWPEYHPGYYGVFMRDPDGNNVEAVHHGF